MRHLATVSKVEEIQPIEGADRIVRARVKGWWVVTQKENFKEGDKCVYYEVDSFLPITPEYDFLLKGSSPKKMIVEGKEVEGIRLKTIKLKGVISQGLILPVPDYLKDKEEGTDVSEELGIIKYEPPIPANMEGIIKGSFPSFIPKTDEERIQNCLDILDIYKGYDFYITSKLDGTSSTFYKKDGEFGVCSHFH